MDILDSFRKKAAQSPRTIVFPESDDDRILKAVAEIQSANIAHPILIGESDKIFESAARLDLDLANIPVICPATSEKFNEYVIAYCKNRENVTEKMAQKLLRKPLLYGAMMVAQRDADSIVCGVAHATSSVIQSAAVTIGFASGITNPSSLFIMVIPEFRNEKNKILVFADSAVTIKPTPEQLAEIAVLSGRNAKKLVGIDPKIALLSFSTKGSASHAETEKVITATGLARQLAPELTIDGELQADAALIPEVAQKKVKQSNVAGQANVLIFPDLNSGNIAYKLVQYLGRAQAIGPFLQGFARPVSDLSRGASVTDIVNVAAVTVVQAQ
ncbi:MAG: phosphate acetyltransferase [Candidatus Zhuqueibacterota bacterium]